MVSTRGILVDITKCIGCRSCEQACKQIHGFPTDTEYKLSTTALTVVEDHGDRFVRKMCMHCQDPACASACLVGALKKSAAGPALMTRRSASAAVTAWWLVLSACRVTSGRSWCPT